jgi:hypothetical protein
MIHFACECGSDLRFGESSAGQWATCPGCGDLVQVPHPDARQPDQSNRRCPECDSDAIQRITSRRELCRKVPGGDPLEEGDEEWNKAFVFRLPRECRDCGAIWVPPLPRTVGALLALAGILLILFILAVPLCEYFFPSRQGLVGLDTALEAALAVLLIVGYGWYVASGRSARARILRAGDIETDAADEPGR